MCGCRCSRHGNRLRRVGHPLLNTLVRSAREPFDRSRERAPPSPEQLRALNRNALLAWLTVCRRFPILRPSWSSVVKRISLIHLLVSMTLQFRRDKRKRREERSTDRIRNRSHRPRALSRKTDKKMKKFSFNNYQP